jgi:hypothetical protein
LAGTVVLPLVVVLYRLVLLLLIRVPVI